MRRIGEALILICVAGLVTAAQAVPEKKINEIRRPLFSAPAIVRQGDSFDIVLKIEGDKKPSRTTLVAVADSYSAVGIKLTEDGAGQDGIIYKAAVPANAPEALYDLRILFTDGTTDAQLHSVKIIKEFKKDYDFVHLTDIHFNDPINDGKDSNLARIKLLYEIAKVNPEFILFGGDLMLNPVTYDRDYPTGYQILTEYVKSPIFMVPGNHEQYIDGRPSPKLDGRPYWESVYGPYYQAFNYGKLHFVGLNTFDYADIWRDRYDEKLIMIGTAANGNVGPEQFEWLKKDVKAATEAGETPVFFTHVPIGMLQGGKKLGYAPPAVVKGPSLDTFLKFMEEYKVPLVFVGHMHMNYDNKKLTPVTTEIMTQAAGTGGYPAGEHDMLWGFRIVHVRNGEITGSEIRQISHESSQP